MSCFYKQRRDGMKLGIVVTNQGGGSGVKRALLRSGGDGVRMGGGIHPLHVSLAMVCSVAAAADREVRLGVRREREQGRHQRKAEEQQQRKCQKAAHDPIVVDGSAAFVRRSGMSREYFFASHSRGRDGSRTKDGYPSGSCGRQGEQGGLNFEDEYEMFQNRFAVVGSVRVGGSSTGSDGDLW